MSIDVGGQFFADWTNLAGIVAGSASCLAVQLSTSRLLFIMGRDGVLPKRVFGYISPRTLTPVYCVLLTGAMCFVGLNLSLQTATGFINFGAFTAFTAVNVCVIAYYLRHRHEHRLSVVGYVVIPAIGAAVSLYMLSQLSETSLAIGLSWLGIGVMYLLWLTRGFRRPTPELSIDYEQSLVGPEENVEPAGKGQLA
jgi:amino acid transporter